MPTCGGRHAQHGNTYSCETVLQHRQVAAALPQAALVCDSQGLQLLEGDAVYKGQGTVPVIRSGGLLCRSTCMTYGLRLRVASHVIIIII